MAVADAAFTSYESPLVEFPITLLTHIYCSCQVGAEIALKREVAVRAPDWRLAFSRPGFVTFKLDQPTELRKLQTPRLIFARAIGGSLGKLDKQPTLATAAKAVWELPVVADLVAAGSPLRLHVWQRDSHMPGEQGFEPGPTPMALEARQAIVDAAPEGWLQRQAEKSSAKQISTALDVIMVEPNQWWIGCHSINTRAARWPGGVPMIELPEHAVSRAYLKLREALAWGHLPTTKGDEWIELGCAPGGASQALLDAGMHVIGVDPAEVDPEVAEHPRFCHLRCRAADAKRKEFIDARWLAADINAAPRYTLDAVESVVTHASASIRGLVLTLKLPEWDLAGPEEILKYFDRIRGWGYRDIRARQLAFNRQEMCVVALRSRGQRRQRR